MENILLIGKYSILNHPTMFTLMTLFKVIVGIIIVYAILIPFESPEKYKKYVSEKFKIRRVDILALGIAFMVLISLSILPMIHIYYLLDF